MKQLNLRNTFQSLCILTLAFISADAFSDRKEYMHGKMIFSLFDTDSIMWVNTGNSIVKVNKVTDSLTIIDSTTSNLINAHIYAVVVDSSKNIWLGTQDGLVFFNGKNWNKSLPYPSSNFNELYALHLNANGGVWVGAQSLLSYDGVQWINLHTDIVYEDWVYTIEVDQNGVVYAGTNFGLIKRENQNWAIVDTPCIQSGIAFDKQNCTWTSSFDSHCDFNGLRCNSNGKIDNYLPDSSSFISSRLSSIVCDSDNNIWISSDNGIVKFNRNQWDRLLEYNMNLPSKSVKCMKFDNANNLWVGTDSGLVVFKTNTGIKTRAIKGMRYKSIVNFIGHNLCIKGCLSKPVDLTIRNINGKILWQSKSVHTPTRITISNIISSGMYLIEMHSDEISLQTLANIIK